MREKTVMSHIKVESEKGVFFFKPTLLDLAKFVRLQKYISLFLMQSSLPTLRPYPWNPPMTCIYTGHPSACSLSSLPRLEAAGVSDPFSTGRHVETLGEIFHSNWGGRKNTNGDMNYSAKFSESYCILLRDFCSEIWNIKMIQTKTHWHQPPGKKSLTETGFHWKNLEN